MGNSELGTVCLKIILRSIGEAKNPSSPEMSLEVDVKGKKPVGREVPGDAPQLPARSSFVVIGRIGLHLIDDKTRLSRPQPMSGNGQGMERNGNARNALVAGYDPPPPSPGACNRPNDCALGRSPTASNA
jgi:hypothetical protein